MHDTESKTAIELKNLHKSFDGKTVFGGLNLEVAQGETIGVLGRSGTGKSILLKLIVGLQKPDSGSIRIHGTEISHLPFEELNTIRKRIGFLFQEAALYDSMTLEQNVIFPLQRQNKTPKPQHRDRARELLSEVGMQHDLEKLPSQISGGMKKRVGLARALTLDPDILLLDEPTAGLDPITAGEIEELILKLHEDRGVASIVVTHDLHGAKTVSNRLALIHEGDVRIEGTFEDLKESRDPFVAKFFRERKE